MMQHVCVNQKQVSVRRSARVHQHLGAEQQDHVRWFWLELGQKIINLNTDDKAASLQGERLLICLKQIKLECYATEARYQLQEWVSRPQTQT